MLVALISHVGGQSLIPGGLARRRRIGRTVIALTAAHTRPRNDGDARVEQREHG